MYLTCSWSTALRPTSLFGDQQLPQCAGMAGTLRIDVAVKDAMRDKILSQSEWSSEERIEILDYCVSDVEELTSSSEQCCRR